MRKALIAVIVASALFAVGAFAASFTLETENVASQSASVGSCAAKAVVNFDTSETINTSVDPDDYVVTVATVTFVNNANNPVTTCNEAKADLAIDKNGTWQDLASVTVSGSTATFTLPTDASSLVPVRIVTGVSVLADGVPVPTPAA